MIATAPHDVDTHSFSWGGLLQLAQEDCLHDELHMLNNQSFADLWHQKGDDVKP